MLLESSPVLNAIHLIHEQKTKPAVKIDSGLHFMLDF